MSDYKSNLYPNRSHLHLPLDLCNIKQVSGGGGATGRSYVEILNNQAKLRQSRKSICLSSSGNHTHVEIKAGNS